MATIEDYLNGRKAQNDEASRQYTALVEALDRQQSDIDFCLALLGADEGEEEYDEQ